jgi:hypothetical protein
MPDTGAPWDLPYPAPSGLVRDAPVAFEDLADAVADGLTAANIALGPNVVTAFKDDVFSTSSTTYVDLTGLSATITPSTNTSKVLVIASLAFFNSNNNSSVAVQLVRGSTAIGIGAAAGSRRLGNAFYDSEDNVVHAQGPSSIMFLDSPATTAATTYKLQIAVNAGTAFVNRTRGDSDDTGSIRIGSSITVIEVAA